ncbi:MAG: hypothetical protein JSV50_12415 [Desulfobacteraceae bacterium]|nr:MAG: hypothetical protein JSV50_12415 [Desulfobacteraceae bacterium]
MHPRVFFDGFWCNDLKPQVFVAMSFREDFRPRWNCIFTPAIEEQPLLGQQLKAVRVDIRQSGDSILTEILVGVGHSQLVLADVSVTDRWEENGKPRCTRKG